MFKGSQTKVNKIKRWVNNIILYKKLKRHECYFFSYYTHNQGNITTWDLMRKKYLIIYKSISIILNVRILLAQLTLYESSSEHTEPTTLLYFINFSCIFSLFLMLLFCIIFILFLFLYILTSFSLSMLLFI